MKHFLSGQSSELDPDYRYDEEGNTVRHSEDVDNELYVVHDVENRLYYIRINLYEQKDLAENWRRVIETKCRIAKEQLKKAMKERYENTKDGSRTR